MSGRQQVALGSKRPTGRQWQHFDISNHSTSKEASFGNFNIIMQFQLKSHLLETAVLFSRVPQFPSRVLAGPNMLGDGGCLRPSTVVSSEQFDLSLLLLTMGRLHLRPYFSPSCERGRLIFSLRERIIQDHPRKSGITIVARRCQPQSHGTANGGGTSTPCPS